VDRKPALGPASRPDGQHAAGCFTSSTKDRPLRSCCLRNGR
jgi:hypothetical protein